MKRSYKSSEINPSENYRPGQARPGKGMTKYDHMFRGSHFEIASAWKLVNKLATSQTEWVRLFYFKSWNVVEVFSNSSNYVRKIWVDTASHVNELWCCRERKMVFTVISLFALPTERKLLFTCIDGDKRGNVRWPIKSWRMIWTN